MSRRSRRIHAPLDRSRGRQCFPAYQNISTDQFEWSKKPPRQPEERRAHAGVSPCSRRTAGDRAVRRLPRRLSWPAGLPARPRCQPGRSRRPRDPEAAGLKARHDRPHHAHHVRRLRSCGEGVEEGGDGRAGPDRQRAAPARWRPRETSGSPEPAGGRRARPRPSGRPPGRRSNDRRQAVHHHHRHEEEDGDRPRGKAETENAGHKTCQLLMPSCGTTRSGRRQRGVDPGAPRVRLEHGVRHELRVQTIVKARNGRAAFHDRRDELPHQVVAKDRGGCALRGIA